MIKATLTPILNAADDCQTLLLPYLSNHPGSTLEFFVGAVISIQSRPAQNPNALPSLPPLNETPTTIEKFLTSFPSVHPVAAHAIMCSGLYVHDFAELPEEAQRARTQGFSVPVRSLRLFSKHIAGLTDRIRAQSGVSPEVHEGKEGALTCAASVDNGAGQGLGCAHLLRPEIGCACGGGRRERLDDGVALEGSCLNGERESVTRGDGPAGSRSQGRKVGSDPFSADRSAGNQAQRPCEGELSSEGKEVGHAAGSAAPPRFALGEGRLLTTAALEKSVAAAEEAATTQLSRGQEEAGGRALSTEAAPPNALQKDERCKSGKSRAAERGQISGTSTNSRMDGKPSPDTGPDASTRSASAKARGEKGGRAADDSAAARDDRSRRHSAKRLTSKNPAVAFPNILQKIDKTWQQAGGGDPEVASSSRGPVQNGGNAPCDPVHSAAAAAGAPHEWEGGVISNAEENGQRAGVGHTECRSGGKRKAACVASPARKRVRGPDLAMQRAIRTLTRPDGVDDGAEKKEPVKEGLRSGLIRIPLPELQTSGNGEKRIQEKTKRATQEAGRAQRSPQSDPCTARHEEGRGGRGGPGVGNCKDSKGTPQAQGKRKGRAESLRASKRNRNVGTQAEPGSRIVLQASKTIMVSNQSTAGLERNERSEVNDERIPRSGEGGTQGRAETAGRWVGQRRAICCGTAMAGQPVRTVQGAEAGAARRHTLRARPWPQQKQNESVSNAPFDEDSEAPAQWSADADYEPLPRGRRNLRTITARATSTDALALEGAANAANAAEGAARPLQVGAQTTQVRRQSLTDRPNYL